MNEKPKLIWDIESEFSVYWAKSGFQRLKGISSEFWYGATPCKNGIVLYLYEFDLDFNIITDGLEEFIGFYDSLEEAKEDAQKHYEKLFKEDI